MAVEDTPTPDPTTLTQEALQREVSTLKELLELRILDSLELVQEKIGREHDLCEEQFHSVKTQLDLIERQRVEQKADTSTAVAAALSAAKEAVQEQTTASERSIEKSETATVKSIEESRETFTTALDGQRRDIDELKEQLNRGRGRESAVEKQSDKSLTWAVAILGAFLTLVVIVVNVLTSAP